jgi:hypothetical protein
MDRDHERIMTGRDLDRALRQQPAGVVPRQNEFA